jgi:hypothetical protein
MPPTASRETPLLPLRELQLKFVSALYEGGDPVIADAIDARTLSAGARLGVYRNNLREGFIKTLALEFPVIERLVGQAFFRQTALDYQLRHPSRSGDLTHVGAHFSDYLRGRFGTGDHAYLPDVAALEWAMQMVAIAPDAASLTAASLADVDPRRYDDLVFAPHPATRLVDSRFPLVRIWQSNQPGAADERIDLDAGGDRILVRRRDGEIEFLLLESSAFLFARMLSRRTPLGLATDATLAVDPAFDLARALRSLVLAGAFARAGLPD